MAPEESSILLRGSPTIRAEQSRTQIMGKPVTVDNVLKTVGAVMLAVCGWTLNKAWDRMEKIETKQADFDARLIRAEERQSSIQANIGEVKIDVHEIKRLLEKRP